MCTTSNSNIQWTWHTTTAIKLPSIETAKKRLRKTPENPTHHRSTHAFNFIVWSMWTSPKYATRKNIQISTQPTDRSSTNQKSGHPFYNVPFFLTSSTSLPGNFPPSSCCKACRGGSWQFCGMELKLPKLQKTSPKNPPLGSSESVIPTWHLSFSEKLVISG